MLPLEDKQKLFPHLVSSLYSFIKNQGYELTLGESWRNPEIAKVYESQGKGVLNSLHTLRLAQDICLFKNGIYLTKTSDYLFAGEYWESLSTQDYTLSWGGRFLRADGNHFSLSHNGIK